MATVAEWVEGARPRTLFAALAPVLAGSAIALHLGSFLPGRALLALIVALALQVGVNFANDYSDGIRGTDADRVGPQRLVGSGAARPVAVRNAAFACFGVAALAGLALVVQTQAWWLLPIGVAAIVSGWYYTGGRRPYGYLGLGEVFVFVFFGLVAVCGTTFVQAGFVPGSSVAAAVAIGALACAILVANNLRDIGGDTVAGKRTLAVRLGDRRTRWFFVGLCAVAALAVVAVAAATSWAALLGLAMVPFLAGPVRLVLKLVGIAELAGSLGLVAGLAIA